MSGILLVTHSGFATGLIESAKTIYGDFENVEVFSIEKEEYKHVMVERLINVIKKLNDSSEDSGVLILTDMFGGTPSNFVSEAMFSIGEDYEVLCLSGVNMPIVLEAISKKDRLELRDLLDDLIVVGLKSIKEINVEID